MVERQTVNLKTRDRYPYFTQILIFDRYCMKKLKTFAEHQLNEGDRVYVKYLDSKNNFREAKKDFKSYDEAWEWIQKTFDKPSKDFIHYY